MQADSIEIFVNENLVILPAGSALRDVLKIEGISDLKGLAVAVNGAVVPLTEWDRHTPESNDRILIIRATQGG